MFPKINFKQYEDGLLVSVGPFLLFTVFHVLLWDSMVNNPNQEDIILLRVAPCLLLWFYPFAGEANIAKVKFYQVYPFALTLTSLTLKISELIMDPLHNGLYLLGVLGCIPGGILINKFLGVDQPFVASIKRKKPPVSQIVELPKVILSPDEKKFAKLISLALGFCLILAIVGVFYKENSIIILSAIFGVVDLALLFFTLTGQFSSFTTTLLFIKQELGYQLASNSYQKTKEYDVDPLNLFIKDGEYFELIVKKKKVYIRELP